MFLRSNQLIQQTTNESVIKQILDATERGSASSIRTEERY